MTAPLVQWFPLPDNGRECPLLDLDQWGRVRSRALLRILHDEHGGMKCRWQAVSGIYTPSIQSQEYWQTSLAIDVPARARRARLEEVQTDPEVERLLLLIDAGWTIQPDPLFGADAGTLTPDARDALAALHVRVHALVRARPPVRVPAHEAREPA